MLKHDRRSAAKKKYINFIPMCVCINKVSFSFLITVYLKSTFPMQIDPSQLLERTFFGHLDLFVPRTIDENPILITLKYREECFTRSFMK